MTKLLFDALTPKQARIAAVLHLEGAKRGVEIVITCREYMHVGDMLRLYGVPHRCIGKYGVSLYEKLVFGLERQRELADIGAGVDAMLGFPSPDAARVIFGLGKPLIILNDTPHAAHVNRLVIPLSEVLISPAAVSEEAWRGYCPKKIVFFNGVFEYMWVSRFVPDAEAVRRLGLSPGTYVVFRPEEAHAAYYKWSYAEVRMRLIKELKEMGYVVVNVPRYPDQVIEGVVNITEAVDHLQLAYFSAGVITGGASMATEAALLGVPALSYFPGSYYVDKYLVEMGAPLYRCKELDSCLKAVRVMLQTGKTAPPKLEDPTQLILKVAEEVLSA